MAYSNTGWSTVSATKKGTAPSMFTYSTSGDTLTQAKASGYFNSVEGLITTGDALWLKASNGQALCMLTNTSGTITVTDLTT